MAGTLAQNDKELHTQSDGLNIVEGHPPSLDERAISEVATCKIGRSKVKILDSLGCTSMFQTLPVILGCSIHVLRLYEEQESQKVQKVLGGCHDNRIPYLK